MSYVEAEKSEQNCNSILMKHEERRPQMRAPVMFELNVSSIRNFEYSTLCF